MAPVRLGPHLGSHSAQQAETASPKQSEAALKVCEFCLLEIKGAAFMGAFCDAHCMVDHSIGEADRRPWRQREQEQYESLISTIEANFEAAVARKT